MNEQLKEVNNRINKLKITRNLFAFTGGLSLVSTSLAINSMVKNTNISNGIEVSVGCLLSVLLLSECFQKDSELTEFKNNQKQIMKLK